MLGTKIYSLLVRFTRPRRGLFIVYMLNFVYRYQRHTHCDTTPCFLRDHIAAAAIIDYVPITWPVGPLIVLAWSKLYHPIDLASMMWYASSQNYVLTVMTSSLISLYHF